MELQVECTWTSVRVIIFPPDFASAKSKNKCLLYNSIYLKRAININNCFLSLTITDHQRRIQTFKFSLSDCQQKDCLVYPYRYTNRGGQQSNQFNEIRFWYQCQQIPVYLSI